MGLLSKLKSLLGRDDADSSAGSGVDVTVEHDPGTDADESSAGTGAAAAETDATDEEADSESGTDEPSAASEPDEPTDGTDGEAASAAESAGTDEDVEVLKGIGPAYADRLRDAGVETVADLAAADADDLAAETDLSAKRVGRWIERAQDR